MASLETHSPDNLINLTEWIIPINDSEKSEREQQEAPSHRVSEITSAEEPQPSISIGLANSSGSIPEAESTLSIGIPTTLVSSRRTRHSNREYLGQLTLDFGDGGKG